MIEEVTVYRTKGQQFERFEEAVQYRENLVEKFMRECPGFYDLPLKLRTKFMESILTRRNELRDLLNYKDELDPPDYWKP